MSKKTWTIEAFRAYVKEEMTRLKECERKAMEAGDVEADCSKPPPRMYYRGKIDQLAADAVRVPGWKDTK